MYRTTADLSLFMEGGVSNTNIAQFARRNGANADLIINGFGDDPQFVFQRNGSAEFALGDDSGSFKLSGSGILGTTDLLTITAGGNLGTGTTTPWRTLSVTGTVGFDGLTDSTGAGSLCLDSNKQVVYNSGSDNCLSSTRATKHDIQDLDLNSLSLVEQLQPVSFVYNQGDGRVRYGFIAEDTANVDAHLATYDASGAVSGIDDRSILAIVTGAIKDLYARVQEYFARTERLEERVSALEAELAAVRAAESAGAPEVLSEAPTSEPASSLGSDTDSPSTATSADAASSTPDIISPSSTDEEAAGAVGGPSTAPSGSPGTGDAPDTDARAISDEDASAALTEINQPNTDVAPEPANDNFPTEGPPTTRTD